MGGGEMKQIEIISVPNEFLEKFPKLSIEKANKYYNRYLMSIRQPLIKSLAFTNDKIVSFPKNQAKRKCGSFYVKKVRYYIWDEFYDILPFFTGHKPADPQNKKLTQVYLMNERLINQLIDTCDTHELVNAFYGNLDTDTVDNLVPIKIDMDSLQAFIDHTTYELENVKNETHLDKLCRNLRCAKYIKIISTFFYDAYNEYVLPQIPSPSEYGRMYYKGISLHSVSKEVRAAALGDHYVYDLNAAVYAIRLYLVSDLLEEKNISSFGKFTYTKEYLDHKSTIRNELAKHIQAYPNGLKLVKEAITAIGFGARISGGAYKIENKTIFPAINEIIKNPADRNRFLNDPWVKNFVAEQHQMTKFIVDEYLKKPDFVKRIEHVKNIKNQNGIFRRTQVMSYLFQQAETMIMNSITDNIDYMFCLHDSIITKKPIPNQKLLDIKHLLSTTFKHFTLSNELVEGWKSFSVLEDIVQHQMRIEQEEKLAKSLGYNTEKQKTINIKITQTNNIDLYDGYDDGSKYNHYDPNHDEEVRFMTHEEKQEHFRIVGYNQQQFPSYIQKLLH